VCPYNCSVRERCPYLTNPRLTRWSRWLWGARRQPIAYEIALHDVVWTLGSVSALHHRAFDAELLLRELPVPPLTTDSLVTAARSLGFRVKRHGTRKCDIGTLTMPCVALLNDKTPAADSSSGCPTPESLNRAPEARVTRPALVVQVSDTHVMLFRAGTNQVLNLTIEEFDGEFTGAVFQFAPVADPLKDPDGARETQRVFGFRWFIPELLKHKRVWRDVLIASLFIQLLALGTPVFTQVVIDKVVVHRTQSTLAVIAIGMALFAIFSALLSWVRQYLVLHTGNRVDAVLGSAVFEHLLKLPPRYFETRPTGVITARLRGVENIREFIASAAVTLVLDLPFLAIFVAIMFAYNVSLTVMALGIIAVIVVLSLLVAPIFRSRLNEQFLLGARNQAFTTEYISGLETVKSLQMEPQVKARYDGYLADYLRSGFSVRQIANTYNVLANGLEQTLGLLILIVGATYVMNGTTFTIGMLVAFQMFASRVSQPMLRLVGLWQQFQQASLSVARLGDIMNAPMEPYSLLPGRVREGRGLIEIEDLSFRYAENLPLLLKGLNLIIEPGRMVAFMGPSGCGKSTLAKLLQGLYRPSEGRIKLDGNDITYLAANELRINFGVVPQDTVLFSGSVYDNLISAHPHASFEQVTKACQVAEIHEVIERLPKGYQTEIGERGVGLSGGQKQRLAIARALIKQPKILIFDEATSSLDVATAEHFCATINQLKGKVTMLFITHALPKNLQVDEIVQIGISRSSSESALSSLGVVGAPA
jgi:subfamily B ATP-binding cassette protein HlyB/CyaB